MCLNPYSTGRWSLTTPIWSPELNDFKRLNPYSTGRWSLTTSPQRRSNTSLKVLILILLEDGL